jgi:hypothetical protein
MLTKFFFSYRAIVPFLATLVVAAIADTDGRADVAADKAKQIAELEKQLLDLQ